MADSSEIQSKADAELQRSKRDQQDSSFLETFVPINNLRAKRKRIGINVFFCALNVASSLTLVLINKRLFTRGFKHVCALTAIHQLATVCAGQVSHRNSSRPTSTQAKSTSSRLHRAHALLYATLLNLSIIGMNFSLLYNGVLLYQIFKLLVLPAVALLELAYLDKKLSLRETIGLSLLMQGSAFAVFDGDKQENIFMSSNGITSAVIAVGATSCQIVFLKVLQRTRAKSDNLLATLSYSSAGLMLILFPFIDSKLAGMDVGGTIRALAHYGGDEWTLIAISCAAAAGTNLSQFVIVDMLTPLTFQILSQLKTLGIFVAGFCLGEYVGPLRQVGVLLGVLGSVLYSFICLEGCGSHSLRYLVAPMSWRKSCVCLLVVIFAIFTESFLLMHHDSHKKLTDLAGGGSIISISSNSLTPFKVAEFPLSPEYNIGLLETLRVLGNVNSPNISQYFSDWNIHVALKRAKMYSSDPREADFIFVPFYTGLYTVLCKYPKYHRDKITEAFGKSNMTQCPEMNILYRDVLSSSLWREQDGLNFIWTSNHVHVRPPPSHRIFFTVEDSNLQNIDRAQNLVIPYSVVEPVEMLDGPAGFNPDAERQYHMIFQGALRGNIRRNHMFEATRGKSDIYRFNHNETPTLHSEYIKYLTNFDFCFTPDGDVATTVRLFEALIAGCIPVLWTAGISLPFPSSINYKDILLNFHAGIPPEVILDTVNNISSSRIKEMRRNIFALPPNQFFSQESPYSGRAERDRRSTKEMGDMVWEEFAKHVRPRQVAEFRWSEYELDFISNTV